MSGYDGGGVGVSTYQHPTHAHKRCPTAHHHATFARHTMNYCRGPCPRDPCIPPPFTLPAPLRSAFPVSPFPSPASCRRSPSRCMSLPPCHSYCVTLTMSLPPCHSYHAAPTVSLLPCHSYHVTPTVSLLPCHSHRVTLTVPKNASTPSVMVRAMLGQGEQSKSGPSV